MTFSTVLVANRGEIARRIIRGAHEMGLSCVAVYVDADADAPFVRDADSAIRLASSYLDVAAMLDAARRSGAGSVHPGYGFLSENAAFAGQVVAAGLTWIGPPASVIATMGDKLAAKEFARHAKVPILATGTDAKDADTIGFPLIVKAAAGGGGKGMRVVTVRADLDEAIAAARREALHGFGDDRVFLERYVAASRHVEIQVLGDRHGNLVHLGERECSIQRRHQKLIEESPSPALDDATRSEMADAALRLARSIGYESAGTVEFLVDEATHDFYFLEVNTRLQVEHPVTEEVTGIDLVREQLRVARGDELGYTQADVHFSGSAIEVRLCAEDPARGFLPATGTLSAFDVTSGPVVRWESGVEAGSVVGVAFDPLLAKVIAYAPTRDVAASTLALALESLHLGGVATNRDFLAATLRSDEFLAGATTTDFIERVAPPLELQINEEELSFVASAAALWLQAERRRDAHVLAAVPSGWRNARMPDQSTTLRYHEDDVVVHYRARRDGRFDLRERGLARVHRCDERGIDIDIDGRRVGVRVSRAGDHLYAQASRGTLDFELVPRFATRRRVATPGGLNAPMPGAILDVRVNLGQRVVAGDTLVVMEAMKMEHVITAPSNGVVSDVFVHVGQQVNTGDELLALGLGDKAAD